ncbi:inositol monophosphatase [Spiractinospora alimapuensis]|uniref:inositol monophosphatase family protein n=1 Tax=Spiractinospora alimapuensis TaxID=2820884 RepID=UPI001F46039F|nr:inositol monophosphatase family protein [Spiractinospora alimapuensis]QVQ53486.1 inositol monophosphatase [Spiractinospora alimapuensis]
MTMTDVDELRKIAVEVAVAGANRAAELRRRGVTVAASKKSPEDIVTQADREVEELIRSEVTAARPDDGFCGEESPAVTGTSGLHWLVDPIDGTVNYLYGQSPCSVSVAVVEGEPEPTTWRALAASVVNIDSGEVYSAARGRGAELDGRPLSVGTNDNPSLALVATGFGYFPEERMRQAEVIRNLVGVVRDLRRVGSAALDLCAVGAGRLDMFYERGLNAWDIAAGTLVAQEAGAKVLGLDGEAASPAMIIATNLALARSLGPRIVEWHREAGLITD